MDHGFILGAKTERRFLQDQQDKTAASFFFIPQKHGFIPCFFYHLVLSCFFSNFAPTADSTKERWYNNIVLNIPHASVGGLGIARWDNKVALLSEVKRWTDWFTDLLFIPDNREGIQFITSDYSCFVVDVERLVNDPLEKIGQGIVYKMYNGLHRTFKGNEEIEMFRYHAKYIRDLRLMLNEHSLLIDCHSFPSDLSDVDICIGYNDDWSRPTDFVIELCKSVFEKHGYQVGINTPYANAIAPETGYTYNSIMIEVNKRRYLNENG